MITPWKALKKLIGAGIVLSIWWLFASGILVLVPRDPMAPFRSTVEPKFEEVPRRAGDRPTGAATWVDNGAPVGMMQSFLTTSSASEVQAHYRSLMTQAGWTPDSRFDRRGKFRSHAKYCEGGYSFTVSTERRPDLVLYTIQMFWTRDHNSDDYCPKSGKLAAHRNQ